MDIVIWKLEHSIHGLGLQNCQKEIGKFKYIKDSCYAGIPLKIKEVFFVSILLFLETFVKFPISNNNYFYISH